MPQWPGGQSGYSLTTFIHFNHVIYKMASSVYISLDIFNVSCSITVKDSIILLSSDNESSDINDIEKSSSILQNQNATECRHEPRNETDDDLVNYPEYNLLTKLV